jgi:prefoldin subunit 5
MTDFFLDTGEAVMYTERQLWRFAEKIDSIRQNIEDSEVTMEEVKEELEEIYSGMCELVEGEGKVL